MIDRRHQPGQPTWPAVVRKHQ